MHAISTQRGGNGIALIGGSAVLRTGGVRVGRGGRRMFNNVERTIIIVLGREVIAASTPLSFSGTLPLYYLRGTGRWFLTRRVSV